MADSGALFADLATALRQQADRLVNGEFVTGLEQINLLYEAADALDGGSSSSLTPGAGDATQGAKDVEPGTASDSPPPSPFQEVHEGAHSGAFGEAGENVLPGSNPGGGKYQHEAGAPLDPASPEAQASWATQVSVRAEGNP